MHEDLNDLAIFAAVVECGSFTAAAQRLGVGKSLVSQRIARLEKRLGMRLVQRTTRQQQITRFGHRYYVHCRAVVAAAEAAQQLAQESRNVVAGILRVVAPPLFSQWVLGAAVAEFLCRYPAVRLLVDQKYHDVDLVRDRYDLAFGVAEKVADSSLVARALGVDWHMLVAAPRLVAERPVRTPRELEGLPSLSMVTGMGMLNQHQWRLADGQGGVHRVRHMPRLVSDDLLMLRRAAREGQGIVALPGFLCAGDIQAGTLVELLPGWSLPRMQVHALYPSREGLTPAARSFLNLAAPHVQAALDGLHAGREGALAPT